MSTGPTPAPAMVLVSTEQLNQLETQLAALMAQKQTADQATAASNAADAAAAQAAAVASQAKLDEQSADAQLSADFSNMEQFIMGVRASAAPASMTTGLSPV